MTARITLEERFHRLSDAGFTGGRAKFSVFEGAGRNQLVVLLSQGLRPGSKVLDIGCGCLRGGYWLISFLEPGCYCGIEPHREMLQRGIEIMLRPSSLESKSPRFDYNDRFDLSVFSERFEFMMARSIWTHASKDQIGTMLAGFAENSTPNGVFLASILPASPPQTDYRGGGWVGRSHDSNVPGLVWHDPEWISEACSSRGLYMQEIRDPALNFGRHRWIAVYRSKPETSTPRARSGILARLLQGRRR